MKIIVLLLSILTASPALSQHVKIIPVDSASDNFSRARLWVANAFVSAQNVIQYENPAEGVILCKGSIAIDKTGSGMSGTIHGSQAGQVTFSLEIGVKTGRARIKVYDLVHEAQNAGGSLDNERPACGGFMMTAKTWASIRLQAEEKIQALMHSFEVGMAGKSEDW